MNSSTLEFGSAMSKRIERRQAARSGHATNALRTGRKARMIVVLVALGALALLAGCGPGAGVEATPIPADIVRPVQPTPDFARTLPPYRLTPITRTPVFVPTRNPNAATEVEAPQSSASARRSLLQAFLMKQPPSAMGIATGGATLLDAPGGSAVGSVPVASTVTVTGRSADGGWLAVYTDDATAGWVPAGALVVYNAEGLTTVDEAFSPGPVATLIADAMIPMSTPIADMLAALPTQAALNAARATAIASGGSAASVATPEPAAALTAAMDDASASDPATSDVLIGTVNTSGNLNLRAAPSTSGSVVASLPAQSQLIVLGRTPQSDWLRVRTPSGDGWVNANFIDVVGGLVEELAVVEGN